MNTYNFDQVGTRVKTQMNTGSTYSVSSLQVSVTLDDTRGIINFRSPAINYRIDPSGDTIVINGTSYLPGSHTASFIYDGIIELFPDANSGSGGSGDLSLYMQKANNLSDIVSASASRTNLGLGSLAVKNSLLSGDIPDISATYATQAQLTTTNGNITTNTSSISALQTEVDAIETGAGLGTSGTYTADNTTNYLSTSTSLKDGLKKLDTQIKTNSDAIGTNTTNISTLQTNSITASGTVTLTNKSISGSTNTLTSIPNGALTNNTISGIALGSNLGTLTFNSTNLTGTSYNGSAGATLNTVQDIATTSSPQFTKVGIGGAAASILYINSGLSLASNFGTNGFGIRQDAATYTSTTSSGTIATTGVNTLAQPTLTSSSATTLTTAATLYIGNSPAAGSNVTITNAYGIYVSTALGGFAGGITTGGGSGSNFGTAAGSSNATAGSSSTTMQVGGSAVIHSRVFLNGSGASTIASNASYANLIVGSAPVAINSSGVHAVFANAVVNPVGTITGSGATLTETATLYVNGAGSGGSTNLALHVGGSSASSQVDGKLIMGGTFRLKGYTVSTLPSGTQGDTAYVTDASSPTAGGTLTGSGSAVRPVFYNGTAWVSMY
jgi:hypothetical protein